ncbi:MAG: hypothetical protein HQK53_02100 [Oligoflexia bacterium]|nr:hypothetical protein [Oligoflexia bacterium]
MKKILLLIGLFSVLMVGCTKKTAENAAPGTEGANAPAAAATDKVTFLLNVVVEPEGAGAVTPANGAFDKGAAIELSATANTGFAFDRFEGDVVGTTNMVQVVMDNNKNIRAIFKAAAADTNAPAAAPQTATDTAAPQPATDTAAPQPAAGT